MLIASIKKQPQTIPSCVDAVELRLDLNPSLRSLIPLLKKPLILKTSDSRDLQYAPTFFDCDWQDRPLRKDGLICSRHIDHTPSDLSQTFAELMEAMPANIYKLATMAHSTLDALRMLIATRLLRAQGKNVIGICMGELGQITRIVSEHTYAYLDTPTAPGQLSVDELTSVYRYPQQEEKWYGLIGDPVEQSPSHITHNKHCLFVKMRIKKEELSEFFLLAK
ncbi:MAG: type I 3-dehydroquinate dehydratase, partial [Chlamydiia bacterium]|nr:type I 3-dehydroquinate dehydratase [Chlamydiia bacterium]